MIQNLEKGSVGVMIILAAQTLGSFLKPDQRDNTRMKAFHYSIGFTVSEVDERLDIVLCVAHHNRTAKLSQDFDQDKDYVLMNNAYAQATHSQAHHVPGEVHAVHKLGQISIQYGKDYVLQAVKDFLELSRGCDLLKEYNVSLEELLQQKPDALDRFADLASDYIKHLTVDEMIWVMREKDPQNAARYVNSHVSVYRHKEGKDLFPDQAAKPCNDPRPRLSGRKVSAIS